MTLLPVLLLAAAAQQAGHLASHLVVPEGVDAWALADFDGDGDRDLLLAATDGDGGRSLRVHFQEQRVVFNAEADVVVAVPAAVVCWAVGDFLDEPGDEIAFLARDALWVRPREGRLQRVHDAPMLLDMPAADALPRWRPVADVDGDGRDEIALVTAQGYRVVDGAGALRLEVRVEPTVGRAPTATRSVMGGALRATLSSEELSDLFVPNEEAGVLEPPDALYAEVSLPRPQFVDADGDGRLDLSWCREGAVYLRLQAADGSFPEERAMRLELPESDDYDNTYLAWRDAGGGPQADLLLTRTDRNTLSFRSDWQVMMWLDAAADEPLHDPDAFLKVDAGLIGGADAKLEHAATLYLAREGERGWQARPALAHRREWALDDVSAFRDLDALVPDATGDGFPDLLEADESGVLEVRRFLSMSGRMSLAQEPELRISVDALAAEVVVDDLNGDGVTDFLVAKPGLWQVHLSYRR